MSFPTGSVPVPDVVSRIAAGRDVTAVWLNELGGVTFSVAGAEFVKVHPHEHPALLVTEAARLRWAVDFVAVPRILSTGSATSGWPTGGRTWR